MPFWTRTDTPCNQKGERGLIHRPTPDNGDAGKPAAWSVHVTVARIVPVIIVVATMALVAAQKVDIGLVEYAPEQIVVYARRHPERMFHDVDLCTSPLDHENERVDEVRHGANIHHWRQWRQIDDDVLVGLA